jgi:hypothetical protein
LVVILAGLLLGGVIAHFFGGSKLQQKQPFNPVAIVTPPPSMQPEETIAPPTPLPSLTPVASPTPIPSATPLPSTTPSASPSPVISPSATPLKRPLATPSPLATHVAVARAIVTPAHIPPHPVRPHRPRSTIVARVTPAPTATPAQTVLTAGDQATTVVRSYLAAMTQGDKEAASAYLATGQPTESFLNSSTAVQSVRSEALSGARYRVTADMRSGGTEYYETFTVESGPGGLQITDRYWIKPQ